MSGRQTDNQTFTGAVQFTGTVYLPIETVTNANVSTSVADAIGAAKLVHQHRAVYAQESGTTAADEERVVHVAVGAGTVLGINVGAVVANIGASTVTVDLHKNGVTVLTGLITLDSGNAAYTLEPGVIDTAAFAADSVLEIIIDATVGGGTLATGLFVAVDLSEAFE